MPYKLLTGATGFLGRYLLRDLMRQGVSVAVLVRPSRMETAQRRIDAALDYWERTWGVALPRPVVLCGEITETLLGLDREQLAWARRHCDSVLHSAASLSFRAEGEEPYRTNVEGVRNVLDFCREAGIGILEHVSTAYVAGLRTGRVLESELDVGQDFANDYERSKLTAEQMVRSDRFLKAYTIFRPSIIVGDYHTGYTSTFHGFYSPLRIGFALLSMIRFEQFFEVDYLQLLGMQGDETKNLVPVDWVSEAMVALLQRRPPCNETYALVSPQPVTALRLQAVFGDAVHRLGHRVEAQRAAASSAPEVAALAGSAAFEQAFVDQLAAYRGYWRDDPQFDGANTLAALPDKPCPVLTDDVLRRLCDYAVAANFGWPRRIATPLKFSPREWLAEQCGAAPRATFDAASDRAVRLIVTGPGGGEWTVASNRAGELVGVEGDASSACEARMHADAFRDLVEGRVAPEQALRQGRILLFDDTTVGETVLASLATVASAPPTSDDALETTEDSWTASAANGKN